MKKFVLAIMLVFSFVLVGCVGGHEDAQAVSIELENINEQIVVYLDDEVNFRNYNVIIKYDDGTSKKVCLKDAVIEGFSTSELGEFEAVVKYDEMSTTLKYKVIKMPIVSVYFSKEVIEIYDTEELDTMSYSFRVLYKNGTEKFMPLSSATFPELDKSSYGDVKVLDAVYEGFHFSINYKIIKSLPISLELNTSKVTAYYGENVELSAITFKAIYENGKEEIYSLADVDGITFDTSELTSSKTLSFEFLGIEAQIEYEVVYREIELDVEYDLDGYIEGVNCSIKFIQTDAGLKAQIYEDGVSSSQPKKVKVNQDGTYTLTINLGEEYILHLSNNVVYMTAK